jgi:hypothetical protein
MATKTGSQIIKDWPEESREAAQLVIKAHGEPHQATETRLEWHDVAPWKKILATRAFYRHEFPAPHTDSIESFIHYRVPPDRFSALAEFDGSVMAERTAGLLSARCHDEEANFLALNLAHDIATGLKSPEDARRYYAKEFLDYRRKLPTPYMKGLRFTPAGADAADADVRLLSDEDLQRAEQEGKKREQQTVGA